MLTWGTSFAKIFEDAGDKIGFERVICDEILVDDDGWSIFTVDDSLAAHFEHTVAITEEGPRVLTLVNGHSIVNQAISTTIVTKSDFLWNVSLIYGFRHQYTKS